MIGYLWTRVHMQPIIALHFELETVLKFYNLETRSNSLVFYNLLAIFSIQKFTIWFVKHMLSCNHCNFFCGSFMLFLSCVCFAFVYVCLLLPCGQTLGKSWPLGSRLWCLILSLLLSHWYPGSGVVLDCIDSWSLPSFLLCYLRTISYWRHSLYHTVAFVKIC